LADIAALQAGSANIAARLRSSGSRSSATPSAAGLIWPVQGVLTSNYGMRWGRMHEGIDIGASSGTPIYAAASGTVMYAGWEGGYGNLTVIDHGNGLATAYGHQSQLAVSNGQVVTRGQVIGYVGSTGHSTGPHLHFEVRVNGSPNDPLSYLS
jgi:murein DD-endopeptidase MepM/ murein hydrolase activator NlpD